MNNIQKIGNNRAALPENPKVNKKAVLLQR